MKKRYLLIVFALVAIILLVILGWAEIEEAWQLIVNAELMILLFVPIVRFTSFFALARFYQTALAAFRYRCGLGKLYRLALAVNFVNQIAPSAGVSGATFISYNLRKEAAVGKVTLIEYGRYFMTYTSYAILLTSALAIVYFSGQIDRILVRIIILLVAGGVVGSVGFVLAVRSRRQLDKVVYFGQRTIDKIVKIFNKNKEPLVGRKRIEKIMREFHDGYSMIIRERGRLGWPFIYALLVNFLEVTTLYLIFLSLGQVLNPGVVIIAYAVANSLGGISLVPGDFGIYEVAMVTVLSIVGIPLAVALSATLLYRVLNKALVLPFGFLFYSQFVSKIPESKLSAKKTEA